MQRRPLIVGNWKMNGLIEIAQDLADGICAGLAEREGRLHCEVVVCPSFTALNSVNRRLGRSSLKMGAQTMSHHEPGAHTGEICGFMLRNVGCRFVILGHSERREDQGETDDLVAKKVVAAFRDGLTPILCVGEKLDQRKAGSALSVVEAQLMAALPHLPESPNKRGQLVVAYEPVWAIGTGETATTEQIQEIHGALRQVLVRELGEIAANRVRILYGGSMKPSNASEILAMPDVDGGLIGGAALTASDFLAIIDAALHQE
ncbi:MAG: triose-phosphate isomerase [Magnetococcales bacterium]|nr:triose-phosphate isomerase [Magnetococcales bacterium]